MTITKIEHELFSKLVKHNCEVMIEYFGKARIVTVLQNNKKIFQSLSDTVDYISSLKSVVSCVVNKIHCIYNGLKIYKYNNGFVVGNSPIIYASVSEAIHYGKKHLIYRETVR